ncbi:cell wall-active antibiotics response protein [Cellulomonas sp. H30R-01]|uniref:cell wall-active antibiotics response protein n=1 Tax=Cellulomonas sp. H30R-01 TaxID=2704467 RepID=UPI00138D2A8E|nr:cell wall-active antibiotics response protein [Cellulomonas sp. H30R-01]QHT56624.1 cell wall-active antibiotics response protein [Cellulomonas sp. H30R-01]
MPSDSDRPEPGPQHPQHPQGGRAGAPGAVAGAVPDRRPAGARSPVPLRTWLLVGGALVLGALVLVVTQGPLRSAPWPWSGPLGGTDADSTATMARGGADSARLVVTGDVATLTVRADAPRADLVVVEPAGADRAATVDGPDDAPVVSLGGGAVVVRVAADVRWEVEVRSGASRVTVDLAATEVDGVLLASGADAIELRLPDPDRQVVVDQRAGAGSLVVRVPEHTGVRAGVTSGAGSATVDGETTDGLGAGAEVSTVGFDPDAPHYEVRIGGGVGSLTVEQR